MANGIDLTSNEEHMETFTADTTLQNTSSSTIYYSKNTFDKDENPRRHWRRFSHNSDVIFPSGTTWYFYCNSDASMAEVSV